VITTSFGTFTGGSLASQLDPTSLTLSIALTGVNGGAGLSVTPPPPALPPLLHLGELNAFTADGSVVITAEPIPEPAALSLLLLSGTLATAVLRRRRR
jgi:hypothetical protein